MNRETLTTAIKMMLTETPQCLDTAIAEFEKTGRCEVCFFFDGKGEQPGLTFIEPVAPSRPIRCASATGDCLMSQRCVNECGMGLLAGVHRV